ncbi:WSC-domain-containing protein [Macroventuria anomochaeta]|uniref:WSC-domain-containing protein n=1 Tax=Macroventuria anomochaeta TaxID=301207 RepID=A0ACB6RVS6_9PLEO|nr:WSC-domain-containing protein [Macroventuria anomochaeta]KAF2625525.1 WSC-domain-containing protein [Macroventuria anomochaeta]
MLSDSTSSDVHITSTATVSSNLSSIATASYLSSTSLSLNATITVSSSDSSKLSTTSLSLNATVTASASNSFTLLTSSVSLNATPTAPIAQNPTLSSTSSATPTPTPEPKTGWYEGCYVDGVGGRSLPQGSAVQGQMTNEKCRDACRAAGFVLAGTDYSGECYCGNTLVAGDAPAPDREARCNMSCNGNQTEICGGPNRISLFRYYLGNEPPPSSTTVSSSSVAQYLPVFRMVFEYKGCYDGSGYRVMQNQQPDDQ